MIAERTFKADIRGEVCACANTSWAYVDLAKRRPVRPPPELTAEFGPVGAPFIEKDFKMPDLKEYEPQERRVFYAARHDTDSNRHVNNTAYLEWAMDSIPEGLYEKKPAMMKTVYRKECSAGAKLTAQTYLAKKNPNEAAVIISAREPGGGSPHRNGESFCEVYLFY